MEGYKNVSFEIVLSKDSLKKLEGLPKSYVKKIDRLFSILEKNPKPWKKFDLEKIEGLKDTYRIRIGKIRVI